MWFDEHILQLGLSLKETKSVCEGGCDGRRARKEAVASSAAAGEKAYFLWRPIPYQRDCEALRRFPLNEANALFQLKKGKFPSSLMGIHSKLFIKESSDVLPAEDPFHYETIS